MRFVLLGDIHVFSLWVSPWRLFNKRIVGQCNLWLNRRHHFLMHHLPAIVQQVDSLQPDAILCTGDFTMTSWPAEFEKTLELFGDLFNQYPTYITPGNHDRYTKNADRSRRFEKYLGQWSHQNNPDTQQIADRILLIRIDPTQANPIHACGQVGPERLAQLTKQLQEVPDENICLAMSHYPIGTPPDVKPEAPLHGLLDAPQLTQVLQNANRPIIYLHGHVHQPWLTPHAKANNITLINAGAPVMKDKTHPAGQGFWEIELDPNHIDTLGGITSAQRHVLDIEGQFEVKDMMSGA